MVLETSILFLLFAFSIEDLRYRKIRILPLFFVILIGILNLFFQDWSLIIEYLLGVGIGIFMCIFSVLTDQSIGFGDALIILIIGLFHGGVFQIYMITFATLLTLPVVIAMYIFYGINRNVTKKLSESSYINNLIKNSSKLKFKDKKIAFIPFLFVGYVLAVSLQNGWI